MNVYIKNIFLFLISFWSGISASQPKVSLPSVSTLQEALFNVRKVILNFPVKDATAAQLYEKQQSPMLTACAKVLYDNAQIQILQTLQEIDNRIAYWRYQNDHQWNYFLTKNPIKWFKGEQQKVEIAHNLEQLQSHQGELYVLLGRLAELGTVYDRDYKTVFIGDYTKAYVWIDELLELLSRVKITFASSATMSVFIIRAHMLKLKLTNIRNFKNDILSEMKETAVPSYVERNWLKYIVLASVLGYGYSTIGLDQIQNSFEAVKNNFNSFIVDPIQTTIKDVLGNGNGQEELLIPQEYVPIAQESMKQFVTKLGLSEDETSKLLQDIDVNKVSSFQQMLNNLLYSWDPRAWIKFVHGKTLLTDYLAARGGERLQKQSVGLFKIAVLTPAILSGWFAYKGYQALSVKDYSDIRRRLVEINSLFIDARKPLDNEQYGKMLYLIYNLKQRAQKTIPVADRAAFIEDLEKIELQEFDVAAKRHIVDDMFRKYSFLR